MYVKIVAGTIHGHSSGCYDYQDRTIRLGPAVNEKNVVAVLSHESMHPIIHALTENFWYSFHYDRIEKHIEKELLEEN